MKCLRSICPAMCLVLLSSAAQAEEVVVVSAYEPFLKSLGMAVVFTAIGLALFGMAFVIMGKVTPFSIRKEIEEDHNTALAIVLASVILGIAIIVAAAIHG
jgi:putative membrane protein